MLWESATTFSSRILDRRKNVLVVSHLNFSYDKIKQSHMAMHSYLSRVLKDRGIVMSSMQQSVYDLVKQKNSVFMNSQTGCGKTLAYLIPILDNILK